MGNLTGSLGLLANKTAKIRITNENDLTELELETEKIMAKKDGKRGKILVVDNNMMTQLSIKALLETKFALKNVATYSYESVQAI